VREIDEICPTCGQSSAVRTKLMLIDEAWVPGPGKDPRLAYFADLRIDDIQPQNLRERPLEQFVDGFFCDHCKRGFVSEKGLKETRRRDNHRWSNGAHSARLQGRRASSGTDHQNMGVMVLYRPVGQRELELIAESGFRRFPPRLPTQPFFYPVLNEQYAVQIARDWNTKDSDSGYH
jgi:hypothetical protein